MLSKRTFLGAATLTGFGLASFALFKKYFPAEPEFVHQIKSYCKKQYGVFDLPEEAVEQLSWLEDYENVTPERNAKLAPDDNELNIEIRRSLARWNCLKLLSNDSEDSYLEFVGDQSRYEHLSYEQFRDFVALINRLGPAARAALRATCFIVKSDVAKFLAEQTGASFSLDSEKFVTDTITRCPEIYPLWRKLNPLSQKFLPLAFMRDTHLRHMLYTEGGENMFAELRKSIKDKSLTREDYELWFCRWLINIAGFRGHENPRGSIYLNRHAAASLFALKQELDHLWENPDYDVLHHYLKIRGSWLQIKNNDFLVHLGCLMRLHHAREGEQLMRWFDSLDWSQRKSLVKTYEEFVKTCKVTPTYAPALLDNLRALGYGIEDAAAMYTRILHKATEVYQAAIEKKIIDPATPLSLKNMARKEFLESMIIPPYLARHDFDLEFSFNAEGELQPQNIYAHQRGLKM